MLDVSDGLLRDGGRIARASGVVLELDPEALASDVAEVAGAVGEEAAWDCVRPGEGHSLLATFPDEVPEGWRVIGSVRGLRVDEAPGIHIEGHRPRHTGWDHFTNGEGRRPEGAGLACVVRSASDLARLEARGADVDPLRRHAVHQRPNALDVGVPTALGAAVRVRDVVTEARSLAADVAVGSHGYLLNVGVDGSAGAPSRAASGTRHTHEACITR